MLIDPAFPHDMYRMLIRSIRDQDADGLLERWLGAPQGAWEQTYNKVDSLPQILDPYAAPAQALRSLLWNVGWDDSFAFIDGLDEATKRALMARSVALWKRKGTRSGLEDMIRTILRVRAVIWDWFDLRIELDVARHGWGMTRDGGDVILVGGRYSDAGEYASILHAPILNAPVLHAMNGQAGTDPSDVAAAYALVRALYDIATVTRPNGEHFLLAYPLHSDNGSEELGIWDDSGSPSGTVEWEASTGAVLLLPGAVRFLPGGGVADEGYLWAEFSAAVAFETALATDAVLLRVSEDDPADGAVELYLLADGTVQLDVTPPGGAPASSSTTVVLPLPAAGGGPRVVVRLSLQMTSVGAYVVRGYIAGVKVIEVKVAGDGILWGMTRFWVENPAGPSATPVRVHDVVAFGGIRHTQWTGQLPAPAPDYLATSSAVEPFLDPRGAAGVRAAPPPHLLSDWDTAADWAGWVLGGDWNVNDFSTLTDPAGAMWFHTPGAGVFPHQSVDPDYVGLGAARAESPGFDTSKFTDPAWSGRVRVWYRPSNWMESPFVPDDVVLQYNAGAGWVDLGPLPIIGGTPAPTVISKVEPDGGNPLVPTDGSWWVELDVDAAAILGHASVKLGILFTPTAGPATTDYGFGVTRIAAYADREL